MKSKRNVSADKIRRFQKEVLTFYKKEGRNLPWRKTKNPYRILVSEMMLQQTQAGRVVPKYKEFIRRFPNPKVLASASLNDVFKLWQGLGYNRRAIYLKRASEEIVKAGHFPRTLEELEGFSGIGPYTARAILVFALGERHVFIETNIRSVFTHYFFPRKHVVSDAEILPLIERTLPKKNTSEWYQALMDYGSMLKEKIPNPSRRSSHYSKQTPFRGSLRQKRGEALRFLSLGVRSKQELEQILGRKWQPIVAALMKEGFIEEKKGKYSLVS